MGNAGRSDPVSFGKRRPGVFYGWWIVAGCAVINFYVAGVYYSGFTVFFTSIVDEFKWSYASLSLALALGNVETGLFSPALGFLSDRYGPRKLMVGGALVGGAGALLLSTAHSLPAFYAGVLVMALGMSPLAWVVVPMTAIANWFRKNIGKATGLLGVGAAAGGLLVPVVAWLITGQGWRETLVFIGIGIWVICIPLALLVRHKPETYGHLPDGETAAESERRHAVSNGAGSDVSLTAAQAVKTANFWLLGGVIFLVVLSSATMMIHVVPYLESVDFTKERAAFVVTAVGLFSAAGRFLFGWLTDTWDKNKLLAVAVGMEGAGVFVIAYVRDIRLIIPFVVLYGLGQGGQASTRLAIIRDCFGRGAFGTITGITLISATVASLAAPVIAGWIFDVRGSYYLAWVLFSAMAFLAVPLALLIKPGARKC